MKIREEADILCRHLSGKAADDSIISRYGDAVRSLNMNSPIDKRTMSCLPASSAHVRPAFRGAHSKMMLMTALLETHPGYNHLFRNHETRLRSFLGTIAMGMYGMLRMIFTKIRCV